MRSVLDRAEPLFTTLRDSLSVDAGSARPHTPRMLTSDTDLALLWLAEAGITPLGPHRWLGDDPSGAVELTDDEVTSACGFEMINDEEWDTAQRCGGFRPRWA